MTKANSIDQLESLTRSGAFAPVVKHLQTMNLKKIPRHEVSRIANLANRVDFSSVAMRILNPIVRGEEGLLVPASDAEKSEYGEALRRMGLIGEALQIFGEVNPAELPVVLLRTALCYFMQWKYEEAIPYLERYRTAVAKDEYAHRIATLNLAAAFVSERMDGPALELLQTLRLETKAAKNQLLYMNSLELLAQVFVRRHDWSEVERTTQEATLSISDSSTRYALYVRKWRAIANSLRSNKVQSELYECRAEARNNGDWETIRECDLYISHVEKDQKLLEYVYFGTPYSSYRKRISELVGPALPEESDYVWNFEGRKATNATFDLASGSTEDASLETGQILHRLMILLCRDFYRPTSHGTLFSNLYPGEHFMQEGSANRVCQSVRRLRSWLEEISPGIEIEASDNGYRLVGDGTLAIRVPREPLPTDLRSLEWQSVKKALNKNEFSKRDIMRARDCSDSAAKRLLLWAVESGHAQTIVWGAQTKYRLSA